MYRRCAEPLVVATLVAALLALAGCGSSPVRTDSVPASSATASTTAAAGDKDEKGGALEKSSPARAEAAAPPEAVREFEAAVSMLSGGNSAGAESAFRTLATTYPTYAAPLVNLAILQTKSGKLDDAEKTLKDATARNGNSAPAFNQLGIVYRRLGRFQEADDAYQRALALDANYASAWLNLGVLCDLYLQQPQRALEAYEHYLSLAPSPDTKVSGWVTELKARLGTGRSARAE
jgi:tetratricopeptide (TPR) repeat protein